MGGADGFLEAVSRIVAWVHENVEYERGNTSVATNASDVLTFMKGVCQDKTHLALGMMRAVGIPAKYVSGLLTRQPGETHAWLEFLHPEAGWLPADPDQRSGDRNRDQLSQVRRRPGLFGSSPRLRLLRIQGLRASGHSHGPGLL